MKLYSRDDYEQVKATSLKDKGESSCPFCDITSQQEYILWRGTHWYIQHNKFPLAGTSKHLLAIPYTHEKYTKNLSPEIWTEFQKVEEFMYDFYGENSYFSFVREIGNKKSIHHLHYHFLPGEMECTPLMEMLEKQGITNDL